jgi:hypothetical protein
MNAAAHPAGVCQICRCTEEDACTLPTGDKCSWFDRQRTLCNASGCIREWTRRERERQADVRRQKAWNPWKVIQRNEAGRALRIVRRRKPKGRAA